MKQVHLVPKFSLLHISDVHPLLCTRVFRKVGSTSRCLGEVSLNIRAVTGTEGWNMIYNRSKKEKKKASHKSPSSW